MAADRKWTPQQRAGIETIGQSLLLSAAAGSGKTAVLSERCAHLVCDGDSPCRVDELLVVTFTKAAASEMKSRIESAIRQRLARADNPHIAMQLALIERAQVSTIHSFCSRLLKQHFHLVGIDPNFITLEDEEATLLRGEVAREMMLNRYELDDSGEFQRLIDAYGEGNDETIIARILRAHDMLCSLIDPDAWRQRARDRIAEGADKPLADSAMGREMIGLIARELNSLQARCASAGKTIAGLGSFEKYVEQLRDLWRVLAHWKKTLESHGIDALTEVAKDLELPKLPPMSNSLPGKTAAKSLMDGIRKEIKEGRLSQLLAFSEAEWRAGLVEIKPHADLFLNLVDEFGKRYAQAKDAIRSLDFSDLERLALRVLREPEGVLAPTAVAQGYHRLFRHVLVDEYQDINELQDAILHLVSRECVSEGNLFCVGDVKQSIYGFRLAEPGRFLERYRQFTAPPPSRGKVIDLQANFRSRGKLLDAVNTIFERLMTADATDIEYDQSHRLVAGAGYPEGGAGAFTGGPIELHLLPGKVEVDESDDATGDIGEMDRAEIEAVLVARRIHELMGTRGGKRMNVTEKVGGEFVLRPIEHRDIVILLRSMQYKASQFADILRAAGIPTYYEGRSGFFEATEVRDLLSLLHLLDNQRQDIPLAAVLRSPLASLPEPEDCLARIRMAYPDRSGSVPFHEAVARYAAEQEDELAAALRDRLVQIARWRDLAHRRPLAEVIWTIYQDTGYLAFCNGLPDGEQRSANLVELHERARQFGTFQRQGLARFMRFLDSLASETDVGAPSVASGADNVVQIMSVHKSKGLEFPVVIIPDIAKKMNLSDASGSILMDRKAHLGMAVVDEARRIKYPSIATTLVRDRLLRQSLAEELRVLYVALTRAREHLILVGTANGEIEEKWAARWAGHSGAFPTDMILGARSMLDWLGPAATVSPGAVEIIRHTSEELGAWPGVQSLRPTMSEDQARMARLEPLKQPPAESELARSVIHRMSWQYPQRAFAELPAARSVTSWPETPDPPSEYVAPLLATGRAQVLPLPRFLSEESATRAAEIGLATHLALEHLDFAAAADAKSIQRQLDRMVDRKLLGQDPMKAINLASLVWLLQSPVGALLREHHAVLRRELPIYFAVAPERFPGAAASDDPRDCVMIRGRIDVLVPTSSGLVIVDYKTDCVSREHVESHAETYRAQMQHYREAIESIAGQPVSAVHLAFLSPQVVHTLRLKAANS